MIRFSQPPALVPGDRVAVIVASSPCNQTKLAGGVRALEAAGLVVDVLASATAGGTEYDYLAGDDVLRATDLTNALADPAYAGIFMAGAATAPSARWSWSTGPGSTPPARRSSSATPT